jgi:rSAM/selenodomain-associated transferase 2
MENMPRQACSQLMRMEAFYRCVELYRWLRHLSGTEIWEMCESEGLFEISVIIPVFNEVDAIGEILRCLAMQRDVDLEVVICDGGSTDGTLEQVRETIASVPFPVTVLTSEKGRARQMNAGAGASRGENFLFLHADSEIPDCWALRKALDVLRKSVDEKGHHRCAGRFRLLFRRGNDSPHFSFYYFLERKARLEKEGCIHGDQGFLLRRGFFFKAGPFDESCPVMEDTRFAETVRASGLWILLPVDIFTSARRFETEGEAARHLLNGILMTLTAVGREDFIGRLRGVYAGQQDTGRLRILPFLVHINRLIAFLPWSERLAFWRDTGTYLCENAWQIAFYMDVRSALRKGIPPGEEPLPWLKHFERRWRRLLLLAPFPQCAAFLIWLLFHFLRVTLGFTVPRSAPGK